MFFWVIGLLIYVYTNLLPCICSVVIMLLVVLIVAGEKRISQYIKYRLLHLNVLL